MKLHSRKGQSTLEYIILVTAVIAVLIIFLNPNTGVFVNRVNATYGEVTNGIGTLSGQLTQSWTNANN